MDTLVKDTCASKSKAQREAAIDLAHLARYTMADRVLEAEILALFAGQTPQTIDRLRRAGDERAWREAAHTLKGSARAIGAWRLADASEEAEAQPGWQDRAAGRKVLGRIELAFAEVTTFIAALPGQAAA